MVYWEIRRKCVKRNEGAWLATRKKNIFMSPVSYTQQIRFKIYGPRSLTVEQETFDTMNNVVLTYKSQNAYHSGNNLPLSKQNKSKDAARTLDLFNHFLYTIATTV